MDYRLLKIKEYSQTINNLREKTRILEIQNSSYQKIIDDLDELSKCLEGYGNPISVTIILNGEQMILEIAAYEEEIFRYKLFSRDDKKDKIKMFHSLAINYSYDELSNFMNEKEKRREEGKKSYKDDYFPIPIHLNKKAALIDNWDFIYDDILNTIMNKLEKERNHMENDFEIISKYT